MIDPELRHDELRASDRTVRQFAALSLLIFGGLAAFGYVRHGVTTRSVVLAALALSIGGTGLVRPQLVTPVFLLALAIAAPIGWVMSRVLLATIYYVVFAPLAFLFRLTGRDVLVRLRRPEQSTYWTPKETPSDPERYLRQT